MLNNVETKRLILRLIDLSDTERINFLVNNKAICATTCRIPYPSSLEDTKNWIQFQQEAIEKGEQAVFAITLKNGKSIVGVVSLEIDKCNEHAELGYWIGEPYWGNHYATEAVAAMIDFGFNTLKLNRICARCMKENIASAKILQKAGMKYEGCLRQHFKKWGEFKDIELYGILNIAK